jgi:hypothetical protein
MKTEVNNGKEAVLQVPFHFCIRSSVIRECRRLFALADTAGGYDPNEHERSILFTKDGYYRAPPALPGDTQKVLGQWDLPGTELQLSEEMVQLATLSSGSIQLLNGWNYISFPKHLNPSGGHNQAVYVFAGVITAGHSIFYYDSSTGLWISVTPSTVIKPLVGYTIYSAGPFTLNPDYLLPNQQTNPYTNVYSGWNLIGYFDPMGNANDDYLHAAMARDAMAPLGSDWSELIGWDAATQQYETSIIKGSDNSIHSEYRLTFPNKGYWLWMNANRTLAYSVTHTYYCSAEWVRDYPPPEADLPNTEADAEGFFDTLKYSTYWSANSPSFHIGDDNGQAKAIQWMDPSYGGQDQYFIDNTNFAYFSGHGWEGGILFGYGSTRQEQELWYYETIWGNTRVDWIALGSCHSLDQSTYNSWKPSFKGLHSIVGWDTLGYGHEDMGQLFATYLKSPYRMSIWEAWKQAADDCVHASGYRVAVLAVDIDGNPTTRECVDDHIYGQGKQWFSPQGKPNSDEFYYESYNCVP